MAITASMVKELREMTGAGMMDCKKALNETNGNMDEAVEYLRKNGQKSDKSVQTLLSFASTLPQNSCFFLLSESP